MVRAVRTQDSRTGSTQSWGSFPTFTVQDGAPRPPNPRGSSTSHAQWEWGNATLGRCSGCVRCPPPTPNTRVQERRGWGGVAGEGNPNTHTRTETLVGACLPVTNRLPPGSRRPADQLTHGLPRVCPRCRPQVVLGLQEITKSPSP